MIVCVRCVRQEGRRVSSPAIACIYIYRGGGGGGGGVSVAQQCEGLLQHGENQLCVVSGEAERRLDLEHVVLQTVIHDHDPVLLHQPDTYTHMIVQTYTHMHVLYIHVRGN